MADWRDNNRLIPDLEFVQGHIGKAADYVRGRYLGMAMSLLRHFPVESPIEAVFSAWWWALSCTWQVTETYFSLQRQREVTVGAKRYRVDFSLEPEPMWEAQAKDTGVRLPRIAIELDGHDFHERTREQVTLRNERDRDLQSDGWNVWHFSGSELNADPMGCVEDAYMRARALYWAAEDEIGKVQIDRHFAEREAAERAAANEAGALTPQES